MRPATSETFGSIPESTTAMAGAGVRPTWCHNGGRPAAVGHSCAFQTPRGSAVTGAVMSDCADAEPSTLVAVTTTRSVELTSFFVIMYEAVVAFVRSIQ